MYLTSNICTYFYFIKKKHIYISQYICPQNVIRSLSNLKAIIYRKYLTNLRLNTLKLRPRLHLLGQKPPKTLVFLKYLLQTHSIPSTFKFIFKRPCQEFADKRT